MRQLVSAVGQSRLNILAAIERVRPNQLILFMDKKIIPLSENQIINSSGISDMDIKFFKLTDVNDIEKMNDEINDYSEEIEFFSESYILTSAGANAFAMKLLLLNKNFKHISILGNDNLHTLIDGIRERHEFTEDSVKKMHSLIINEEKIQTPELEIILNNNSEEFSKNAKPFFWNACVKFENDHFRVIYELQKETENNVVNMRLLKHKAVGHSIALSEHFGKKLFQIVVIDKNNHLHVSELKYIKIRSD